VFWTPVANTDENSVWGNLDVGGASSALDMADIEEKFAKQKTGVKKKEEGTVPAKKKKRVDVVDPNRSKNIEIMLSTMKLSPEEIREALHSYDQRGVFSDSQISSLGAHAPTENDRKALLGFKGEANELSKADRYMLSMCHIERLPQRLSVMLAKMSFSASVNDTSQLVELVCDASAEILSSTKLTRVFEYVLALGNFLNKGTNRGGASGIRLDGLLKFTETKGVDQKTSLLHYLLSTVYTKNPELLKFPEDFKKLKLAAKVTFGTAHAQFRELDGTVTKLEDELQHAPPEAQLEDFVTKARQTVCDLEERIAKMDSSVQEVARYFGVGNDSLEEPFRMMDQFIDAYAKARSEVEREELVKQQRARRAAANGE